ncbi:MAG TPA: RTX toxin [Thermoanaerobaculia bacterium]|nr:RTX toxin [Thermoanaerobaculia bacterium]
MLQTNPLSPRSASRLLAGAFLATALIVSALPAGAVEPHQKDKKAIGGSWDAQGPAPIFGDLRNVPPDGGVVGAVHALAPHPSNPDILYIGAVNGGVWVTHNATAVRPTWEHLTDNEASQSIGAMELDPTDPKHETLVAAPGVYSAYGVNGDLSGVLRTTDGGAKWKRIDGGGVLLDKSISGLAVRGQDLVVSVDFATPFDFPYVGIFRSHNFGATFTQVSQGNGSATGLPGGLSHDLAGDPVNLNRLYTSVVFADQAGGSNGLYRTDDLGSSWTKVSTPAVDAFLQTGATTNVELAVGRHNNVYAAIVNDFVLAAVFRSGDGGATWTQMDLPVTIENGTPIGIHPGGQGDFHLSLTADPTDANLVYIGGDRQPARNEAQDLGPRIFPNSIGSTGFWGRLFRGDASKPAGSQWAHITHSNVLGAPGGGTASGSAPHVDSREMAFDAAGNLLEGDDGGVYRRTLPRSGTGDWFSMNGNLQITEIHDLDLDNNTGTLLAGNQDNDLAYQPAPGDMEWDFLLYGDGGDVDIDNTTQAGIGRSVRYSSVNFLRNVNRSTWNAANVFLGVRFLPLIVLDGGPALVRQFYTPLRLSAGNQLRLVIGGQNGVYESFDRGETIRAIAPGVRANSIGLQGVAYGSLNNPNALYVGGSNQPAVFPGRKLFVRTAPPPAPLVQSLSYPGTRPIGAIAIDPNDGNHAFVVDARAIYRTTDAGTTWTDVTGDIGVFEPSVLRSAAFIHTLQGAALAVGTNRGIYLASARDGYASWNLLGGSMPTAPVLDLRYEAQSDKLVAGLLGRGAWTLSDVGLATLLAK